MSTETSLPTIKLTLRQYLHGQDALDWTELTVDAVIDTGASISLLSRDVVKNKLRIESGMPVTLKNAVAGKISQSDQVVQANVQLNDEMQAIELIDKTFYVLNGLGFPALIGMNILRGMVIKLKTNPTVSINQIEATADLVEVNNVNTQFYNKKSENQIKILSTDDYILNPYQKIWVKVKFMEGGKPKKSIPHSVYCMLVNQLYKQGVRFLAKIEANRNLLHLINGTSNVILITKNALIATSRKPVDGEEMWNYKPIDEKLQFEQLDHTRKRLVTNQWDQIIEENLNTLVQVSDLSEADQLEHAEDFRKWQKRREMLVRTVDISKEIQQKIQQSPKVYQAQLECMLNKYNEIVARSSTDAGLAEKHCVRLIPKNENDKHPQYAKP